MRKPSDWGPPCPNPECSQYKLINRGECKGPFDLPDAQWQAADLSVYALWDDLLRDPGHRLFRPAHA